MAGSIDPITTRSTAESFQYIGRRAPPLIDRGGKAQQVIPPFSDRLEGHIMLDNTDDGGGNFEPPWQMQMPVAQTIESRTKIQVQQFGNRHAEIRVAMSIDRQALQARDRLADGAFDGGTRLPGCQEQRLVVDDAPLVKHVRVRADGVPSTLR